MQYYQPRQVHTPSIIAVPLFDKDTDPPWLGLVEDPVPTMGPCTCDQLELE